MTLPTGEKVKVTLPPGKAPQVMLDGDTTASVHQFGDKVYVVPPTAFPLIRSGKLDREAFEVTGIAKRTTSTATTARPSEVITRPDGRAASSSDETLVPVDVEVLDRHGKPAGEKAWEISAFRIIDGDISSTIGGSLTNGKAHLMLPPGVWNFGTDVFVREGEHQEVTVILQPDIRIDGPAPGATGTPDPVTVVLNGRRAVPSSLNVSGLPGVVLRDAVQGWSWTTGHARVSSIPGVSQDTDVYVTPVTTTTPGLTFTQLASYRQPEASFVPDGGETTFNLTVLSPDEKLQGTRPLTVRAVAPEHSAVLPSGTFALMKVGGKGGFSSSDEAIRGAVVRKAAGAILWAEPGEGRSLQLWGSAEIPVLAAPVPGSPALAAAMGTATVRGTMTVDQFFHPFVNLGRQVAGQIPATPSVTYPASTLARVRHAYFPQPDAAIGVSTRASARGIFFESSSFVKFGTSRVDYVTPGFPWDQRVGRGVFDDYWGAWRSPAPQTFSAGQETREEWGAPVQRPAIVPSPDNLWLFRLLSTSFAGSPSFWTDRAGHVSSSGNENEPVTWRLSSEGQEIQTYPNDGQLWSPEAAKPGKHRYELSYDAVRTPQPGMKQMRARTTWTFPLTLNDLTGDPENPMDGEIVPMLSVNPKIPVDDAGTVPAGTTLTFDIDATVMTDPSCRVDAMKVWTWAEGTPENARTEVTSLKRLDADTYRATITTPKASPGTLLGLRITATGSKETTIDQTLDAAVTLR
ncbi:MAG: Peptidase protein [Actinomycetota bacterium]|nr:Peptidase protein [Actinomycetota bacterium]